MESNAFLDSIFENGPYSMWISDAKGTLIRLNQACRDLLHIKDDEVVGKYNVLQDEVVEEQGVLPLVKRVFEQGKTTRFSFEYDSSRLKNLALKEKVSLFLEVTVSPIFDRQGRVSHAIFQHIDITKSKRAEELLRESENTYRSIFETTGTATIIVEEDMTISLANAELEKLTGYSRAEIEGKKKWTDFVVKEDLEAMKGYHYARRNTPGSAPRSYEFRLLDRQGNVKNVLLTVALIAGTRKTIASILDISARKRAEELLRQSEEKYRLIAENTADIISINNMNLRFTYISPSIRRIRGITVEEAMNQTLEQVMTPESLKIALAAFEEEMKLEASGTADPNRIRTIELEEYKKDGSIIPVEASLSYLRDKDYKPIGILAATRDLTERKQAEEALHKSEESARRLAEENAVIAEIGRIISSTLNIEEAYKSFSEKVKKLLPYDRITISLINKDGHTLTDRYVEGEPVPGRNEGDTFPKAGTFTEAMVENRKGLIIDSRDGNAISAKYPGLLPEMSVGYRSFLSVPLISGDQPIGCLHFRSKQSGFYSEKDLRLAENIGNHIAGAIANAQLYLERKRAEEGLREREERLRLIAENARVVIWTMDMNLRYTYISPYIKYNLDYTPEEYVLKPLHEVLTPSSLELCMQLFAEELEEEKNPDRDLYRSRTIEVEHIHRDGRLIWAEIHMTFIRDAAGNAVGILGITRDITERKRAEDTLRRSEESARRLAMENEVIAEIGRIISSSVNIDDVYEQFVQETRKIIHFDRIAVSIFNLEEMTFFIPYVSGVDVPAYRKGREFLRLSDELLERAGRVRPGMIYQVSAEREVEGEEKVKKELPSFLPLYRAGLRSIMRTPLMSKDQPIGGLSFLSLKFDAYAESDLRIAEKIANQIAGAVANAQLFQKQKRTEEELLKSGERYRRLVEMSPLMISVQKQGKYAYLNPAALKALGASKSEELLGRSILELIHPDFWDAARERQRLVEEGKPVPLIEEKIIRLDKKVIDVELTQIEVLDRDELTVMVMGRDITEQKKAEKEKGVLQEQLQQAQKMEAIGTLAGGIAHDFNNILAGILGYAELAGLDIPEDSKARYNLQKSIKSAHRAKDLVSQILAFSRQGTQERKPMDIRPIVKEALKFLRSSLPATIEIRQEIEKDLGAIEADPTQVYQVLMNLCTNAAHAMGDHGGVLEVSLNKVDLDGKISASAVMGTEPGPYLRLRVRDTGHGMPPDVLKRIFDPYFTTKEVGKGTGLGLAVVHGIVKSYGGGIAVSSEVGKGSTFDIYFPRIGGVSLGLVAEKVEPLPLGGHERVLFVDDEQTIVEVGQKILEHLGYEVVARTSSVEALELFKATPERFDLVITDMTMPNMTGDRLAQEILGIRPRIPVILCTGFSEYISEERAKALGIREFVMKPLVMMDLAKATRRALDFRKKRKG